MQRRSSADLDQVKTKLDEKLKQARQAMVTANIKLAQDRWDELINFAKSQNLSEADLPLAPLFYERGQWQYLVAKGYYDTDPRDLYQSGIYLQKAIGDFCNIIMRKTTDIELKSKAHRANARAYYLLLKICRQDENFYDAVQRNNWLTAAIVDYVSCLRLGATDKLGSFLDEDEADKNHSLINSMLMRLTASDINQIVPLCNKDGYLYRFFDVDIILQMEANDGKHYRNRWNLKALLAGLQFEKDGNLLQAIKQYSQSSPGTYQISNSRLVNLFNPYGNHIDWIMKNMNDVHSFFEKMPSRISLILRCLIRCNDRISTWMDNHERAFWSQKKAEMIDYLISIDDDYKNLKEEEWNHPTKIYALIQDFAYWNNPHDSAIGCIESGKEMVSKRLYPEALGYFNLACEKMDTRHDPRIVLIHRERAKAFYAAGDYGLTVLAYEKAIEACPNSLILYEELGLCLEKRGRQGDGNEAKKIYQRGLSRKLNSDHRHEIFGINLLGDITNYEAMAFRLAWLHMADYEYVEAKKWFSIIKHNKKESCLLLACIAEIEEDTQAAIEYYIEAIQLKNDTAYGKLLRLFQEKEEKIFSDIDINKLIADIKTLDQDERMPLLVLCFNPDSALGKKMGAKKGQQINTLDEPLKSLYMYIVALEQQCQQFIDEFMQKSGKRLVTSSIRSEKIEDKKEEKSPEEKAKVYYDKAEKKKASLIKIRITDRFNGTDDYNEAYISTLKNIISNYVSAFSLCPSQKIVNSLRDELNEKQENELYENSYYTAIAQMDVDQIGVYLCQMDVGFYRLFSAKQIQTIIKQSPYTPSKDEDSYANFTAGLAAESKQNLYEAMRCYSMCIGKWGEIAYARLLHLFRCNEPTHRKKLDAILKDKDEEEILKLIQNILPVAYQTPFLLQCLNKETALGKRFYTKGFLEWSDRSLEEGILKKVWDCLYAINLDAALAIKGRHPVDVVNINLKVATSSRFFAEGQLAGSRCHYSYHNHKQIKERKEEKKVLGYYHLTIALNPRHAAVHYELGMLAAEEGQYIRAISSFGLAIRRDGNNALYHYELAYAYMKIGRFTSAIADINQAIQLLESDNFGLDEVSSNKLGKFYYFRGQLNQKLDMHEDAIKDFDHAITLYSPIKKIIIESQYKYTTPWHMKIYFRRAKSKQNLKQFDEAIADYEKANKLVKKEKLKHRIENGLSKCYFARGQSKQQSNNFDEAIADYEEALKVIDRWKWDLIAINRFHLAQCYEAKKAYVLAVINYLDAICDKNQEAFPCLIALFKKVDVSDLSSLGNGLLITRMNACKKTERAILFLQCFDPTSALGKKMGAKEGQTSETLNDDLKRIYKEMRKLGEDHLKSLSKFVDVSKTLESEVYQKKCLTKKLIKSLSGRAFYNGSPESIFDKIKTFNENEQGILLLQCFDPNTMLGIKMGMQTSGNNLDRGLLKDIYDYLVNISDYYAHVLLNSEVKEVKEMAQQTITASLQKTKEREEARDRQRKQEREVSFLDRNSGKQRAKQTDQAGKEQEKRRDKDDSHIYPL